MHTSGLIPISYSHWLNILHIYNELHINNKLILKISNTCIHRNKKIYCTDIGYRKMKHEWKRALGRLWHRWQKILKRKSLHGVITRKWRQHGPPKRWYPTAPLHDVIPENGGSKVLRNVGILPQHYTESQPQRLNFNCMRDVSDWLTDWRTDRLPPENKVLSQFVLFV
jgi:hypothetical protein